MEGMPIPSGGLTTYGFNPKAVLVACKDLRETAPGVYEATIRLADRGDYDFIFLLDDPRVINCFDLPVGANPRLHKGRSAVTITPVMQRRELRVGENVIRFKIADLYTREALPGRADVNALLAA